MLRPETLTLSPHPWPFLRPWQPEELPALPGPRSALRAQVWPTLAPSSSLSPACRSGHQRTRKGRYRPRGEAFRAKLSCCHWVPPPCSGDTCRARAPHFGGTRPAEDPQSEAASPGGPGGHLCLTMGSPVPGRHPKSTHTLLLEVPGGHGASGVRPVSSLGWPVLPGRARMGSLAPWAALSPSSFAKSAQGKLFSWQGPPVTCPILMGKAWLGVTPRAGPKPLSLSYHSWAKKHSALRPEGQEEGRMQGFPAAEPFSSSWMETPSLGAGISKVQSKKGEGAGRVTCSGSFQIWLQSQHSRSAVSHPHQPIWPGPG